MLEQMAEALEDQVAALYRRAAAFEEEEFLLNQEVEERQTEINRLLLKLEAMRAERDRVIEKIEPISSEAAAIREEVFNGEEEIALAAIEDSTAASRQQRLGCGVSSRLLLARPITPAATCSFAGSLWLTQARQA